jgi:quercetin dioxygenase-like cupin family protein
MRLRSRLLSCGSVVFLGLLLALGSGAVRAQEATPGAGPPAQEGVTFTPLGVAPGVTLPSPADLIVVRIAIDPGAVSPFDANDPTGGMLVVESGTFTVRVQEMAWTITRGAKLQEAMATPQGDMAGAMESVAMGQEATLSAGDVAYIPGSVNGEVRNDGQEPAVGLVFLVAPGGMTGEAPPAATPVS